MIAGMQRQYKLRPSRQLMWLILFLSLCLVLVLFQLPLAIGEFLMLFIGTSVWAGMIVQRKALLLSGQSCIAFRLEDEGGIVLVLKNGRHVPGHLQAGSLVSPVIVILRIGSQGGFLPYMLMIFPDAMRVDDFRRLRLVLRWGGELA